MPKARTLWKHNSSRLARMGRPRTGTGKSPHLNNSFRGKDAPRTMTPAKLTKLYAKIDSTRFSPVPTKGRDKDGIPIVDLEKVRRRSKEFLRAKPGESRK